MFASGGIDNTIRIWEIGKQCIFVLNGHFDNVYTIRVINDHTIISGGIDGTIRRWDLNKRKCKQVYEGVPI